MALLTLPDFTGEYRLHNVNNPDPDLVAAIAQAENALTASLFSQGANLVISTPPTAAPCLGLRQLRGWLDLYRSYVFSHVQLGVLAGGARKNSEHPGQNAYATRNFFMIADFYRQSFQSFYKYTIPAQATATATDTLTLPTPDPILPDLIAVGFRVFVLELNTDLIVAAVTANTIQFTTAPLTVGQNYTWVQSELQVMNKFLYI